MHWSVASACALHYSPRTAFANFPSFQPGRGNQLQKGELANCPFPFRSCLVWGNTYTTSAKCLDFLTPSPSPAMLRIHASLLILSAFCRPKRNSLSLFHKPIQVWNNSDQSDCFFWSAYKIGPIRFFVLIRFGTFRVTQASLISKSYGLVCAHCGRHISMPPCMIWMNAPFTVHVRLQHKLHWNDRQSGHSASHTATACNSRCSRRRRQPPFGGSSRPSPLRPRCWQGASYRIVKLQVGPSGRGTLFADIKLKVPQAV